MDAIPLRLVGRSLKLRPVETDHDLEIMYRWRSDSSSLYLWSTRRHLVSYQQFLEEFRRDLNGDRHIHLMITKRHDVVIGMIYSYGVQWVDGHCFITTYLDPTKTKRGYGAEAFVLFVNYLFRYFNFHKIYTDVYEYNQLSRKTIESAGFVQEGVFKEHRYMNGMRYSLIRYALYRDKLPDIQKFIDRLQKNNT